MPVTAVMIQTAPPVTLLQTAATLPAPHPMTATAAATVTMTALPHLPPLHPPTAQTQEAAVIQIKDLQGRRKRRNENAGITGFSFFICFSQFFFKIFYQVVGTEWLDNGLKSKAKKIILCHVLFFKTFFPLLLLLLQHISKFVCSL